MITPASVAPLLNLIVRGESAPVVKKQGVSSPYDVVWDGIAPKDRPKQPIITMTIKQVLDWQDSIDARYMSEAAGAYQIMEDTLRKLVSQGAVLETALFNEDTQDRLAVTLLEGRGLGGYLDGRISRDAFASSLAKEWASFPVLKAQQGNKRWVKRGESYYKGDGLNNAHVDPVALEEALRQIKGTPKLTPIEERIAALEDRIASLEAMRDTLVEALKSKGTA